ncbi:MAG: hypothetical protein PF517_00960 [Salinivirgaceae bacterium]|jgi:hypothetical protein|nr:hypothetical protein [Salinivirgaceae bacterium]
MSTFEQNKKEKSILDCFTYDLKSFFYDNYEEIASEETPATVMIVYQKELPWSELEIFNAVQFRIFFDKENLTGSNPINVKFISTEKIGTDKELQSIVDKVISIYGADDYRKGTWDSEDEKTFASEHYRRVWTIEQGESFISIEYNTTDGITLNILFFNNMLKEANEQIKIQK